MYVPSTEEARERLDALRKAMFAHVLAWTEEEGSAIYVGGAANRVVSSHVSAHVPGPRLPFTLPARPFIRYALSSPLRSIRSLDHPASYPTSRARPSFLPSPTSRAVVRP